MDAAPLASVDELTAWMRIGKEAIKLAEELAEPAYLVRQVAGSIYTSRPIGVYLDPCLDWNAAICDEHKQASSHDLVLLKTALFDCGWAVHVIEPPEAAEGFLVKVAYSNALRSAGEWLNFFPMAGQNGQTLNSPGPVQAMLTSGLVGAGLGYGAGWLGERLMPETWRRGKLSKTLALLGGAAGLAPGAYWGLNNLQRGLPFTDNSLFNNPRPDFVKADPWAKTGSDLEKINGDVMGDLGVRFKTAVAGYAARLADGQHEWVKHAELDTFVQPGSAPLGINVNALGQTLWETATPQTAGLTMAALQAAQQMPGGDDDSPGFVTPVQMGNLAAHMGAGYLSGALVGAVLGSLTGMPPETQKTLARTGMYAAAVKTVISKLFGQ